MLSDRQKTILKTIIDEYVETAEPVSSKALAQKRHFDIGAAMIRKEMNYLTQEGFLAQPHTSAGRVPTDKAYRLYIQEQISNKANQVNTIDKTNIPAIKGLTAKESRKVTQSLRQDWLDKHALVKEICHLTSDISKELSVSGILGEENFYSSGFANLFAEPEFKESVCLGQLMQLMDNVEEYFEEIFSDFFSDLGVFIGEENPIKEMESLSLVTGRYNLPEGGQGFISIVGPKRMDYQKNMALVGYISRVMSEF